MKDERRLSILEHLEELRSRLIVVVIAVSFTTIVSFIFAEDIFRLLLRPAPGLQPVFIEMTEMFGAYVQVALVSGLILASPIVAYEILMFAAPGLTSREKRWVFLLLPAVALAFAAGAVFTYFVLLPPAIGFFLTFGTDIATPQIRIGNYIGLVTRLIFWVGLVFEIPIVIFFLARIGLVTPRFLLKHFRYAIVGAFILGAVITPTFDPINQALVSGPIIVLYLVSIILAWVARLGRKKPASPVPARPAKSS